MNYNDLSIIAINASIEAGEKILEIYGMEDFGTSYKDNDSPLTVADIAANDIIVSFLKNTNLPIISEEIKSLPFEERKEWTECWIVDPLDGTKEFINRNGEFTVNIALVKEGKPVLGVIYVPVSRELYVGRVDEKVAYHVETSTIFESYTSFLEKASQIGPHKEEGKLRVVGSKSHMNEDTENFIESLTKGSDDTLEVVPKGSSLKFCLVAKGEADVYPRFAPTMEWDTAAGQGICEAAGVAVIDRSTGLPMEYNKQNLLNNHFIVNH